MTNQKQTYKPDNGVYTVSVVFTIQEPLMEEAYYRHLEPDFYGYLYVLVARPIVQKNHVYYTVTEK